MITVVIPTLNEVDNLGLAIEHTLHQAKHPESVEIIVVDAGSKDGTLESIVNPHVITFCKPQFSLKKYASLNYGWRNSSGDVILFLDADTLLPKHFDASISSTLKDEQVVGGAFEFSFRKPDWKLSLLALGNRIRYRFGNIYYGDQAIFARKAVLDQMGGFPEEPLMEAAFLCKELGKRGKMSLIKPGILTSPRRFQENGFFKVAWFDFNMFIRFNLGLPVSSYANKYWSKNLKS